jgi:cysteinyl-tRNA synthetase
MEKGVRIEPSENKLDPLDFALWKKSKENEPSWDSPWGKGRPGWHIECSVMSQKFLKTDTIDIHAGGRDLIFPHHENEIAQAEALTGKPFAKYWIHHGLLTINGQKMAKSLGNFVTIKNFITKYKDADLLKLFFLPAHYSHPIDYNEDKIMESAKQRQIFDDFFDRVNNWGILEKKSKMVFSEKEKTMIDVICDNFQKAMDDDFNTPQALACLFELVDLGAKFVTADKEAAFQYVNSKTQEFFDIFNLGVKPRKPLDPKVVQLIKERDAAKKSRDFQKADELRDVAKTTFNLLICDTASNVTATAVKIDENLKKLF